MAADLFEKAPEVPSYIPPSATQETREVWEIALEAEKDWILNDGPDPERAPKLD